MVFLIYPAALGAAALLAGKKPRTLSPPARAGLTPPVSLIIVARNAETLLRKKIENCLSLDYPPEHLEIILYSDGSTDDTEALASRLRCPRLRVIAAAEHRGKPTGMNESAIQSRGEILVFSDVDALLQTDALRVLTPHFQNPAVGGVCGQRVIGREEAQLLGPQSRYIRLDSRLKTLESRFGRVTSNDGKLYAIRRELFTPVPGGVTDDLYLCLAVIGQGRRFLFEPQAIASIRKPARTACHEIERRRRIVSTSLRGIYLMRRVLNPMEFGWFSFGLFVNKVLRRLLPLFLVGLFLGTLGLAFREALWAWLLVPQAAFYALALSHPLLAAGKTAGRVRKGAALAYYFCVGNWGMLLGLVDFVSGRRVERWEPIKEG